jgi:hypothetical protein
MSNLTGAAFIVACVLIGCLGGLGVIALRIFNGQKFSLATYRKNLYRGVFGTVVFGAWTVGRILYILLQRQECHIVYRAEVAIYVAFWLLAPPLWFFLEYYAFECGAVPPPENCSRRNHLAHLRAYADYSSKIWAALAALLLGVAAIMFQK